MGARITVVKTSLHKDLIARHFPEAALSATPCPEFREGQVFEVQGQHIACPEGFCDYAWSTIERMVERACKGEQLMWANAFPCCADGLRPVTFHIEPIEDERTSGA